jgi:hypothetical protein
MHISEIGHAEVGYSVSSALPATIAKLAQLSPPPNGN